MKFNDIIGQERIKAQAVQTIAEGRISHAQLFSGNEGSGNLPFAFAYTQYLMCSDKKEKDSCGICNSCVKNEKLIHSDVHFVFPTPNTKGKSHQEMLTVWRKSIAANPYLNLNEWIQNLDVENKQLSINKEDCDNLVKKLNFKPYESKYKVVLFWMPEKLHHASAPKLLKIIEEPPENTIFIFITEHFESILPTILSRLQTVSFHRLSDTEIQKTLIEQFRLPNEQAIAVARIAEGNYSLASKLAKESASDFNSEDFLAWMRMCYSVHKEKSMIDLVNWVDSFASIGREKQKTFLSLGLKAIRECLLTTYQCNIQIQENEQQSLIKFAPFIHGVNVELLLDEFSEAIYEIERNINPKILMLDLSLKIAKLLRLKYS